MQHKFDKHFLQKNCKRSFSRIKTNILFVQKFRFDIILSRNQAILFVAISKICCQFQEIIYSQKTRSARKKIFSPPNL